MNIGGGIFKPLRDQFNHVRIYDFIQQGTTITTLMCWELKTNQYKDKGTYRDIQRYSRTDSTEVDSKIIDLII